MNEQGSTARPSVPDPEYDLAAVNAARVRFGLPPVHSKHPRRARSIYLSDVAWTGIQEIAARMNITSFRGGSVAGFLEALGQGLFDVSYANLSPPNGTPPGGEDPPVLKAE